MDFSFNEEQKMFRETVREFCTKEIAPRSMEMDRKSRIPDEIIKGMANLGLLGMTYSSEYGGSEADPILTGIASEEIGRADLSCALAVFFLVQAAWGKILDRFGNNSTKEKILPYVTKGKKWCGIATTEPDIGSDLANMRTVATRSGNEYMLNGEKMYISGVREATEQMENGGGYVTLVKTDPKLGTRGLTLMYIPVKESKLVPGITLTLLEDWGRTGISTGGFALNNVKIPVEDKIGDENRGFYITMEGYDYARALIGAVCAGAGFGAIEKGVEYLKQRKAFGQPIGRYEGIQFKLAEDYAMIEAAWLLSYRALWMLDRELKGEKNLRFEVSKTCAEAKLIAVDAVSKTANDVLQWFGAFGYTTECPVQMAVRGTRSYGWAEGSTEILKIIVARELLGREFSATAPR